MGKEEEEEEEEEYDRMKQGNSDLRRISLMRIQVSLEHCRT